MLVAVTLPALGGVSLRAGAAVAAPAIDASPTRLDNGVVAARFNHRGELVAQLAGVAADEAMWEVPGSRWAAITHEDGSGLALCTEAKYGFSCRDGDLAVSLLRSPKQPDGRADMGVHRIAFAVGRHAARSDGAALATAAAADALFAPVVIGTGPAPPAPFEWIELGSLVPCWVVPASRGYVIRLHEVSGGSGTARLRLARPARALDLVDLMGRRNGTVRRVDRRTVEVAYRPYQIVSVRVRAEVS